MRLERMSTEGPNLPLSVCVAIAPAGAISVAAFRAGASGTVQLRVSVDAKGRLEDVEIESSSGREDLDAAAMDAARQWTYAPGQRDGMPVAGTLRIPVDYSFDP